jgi:hypothetical protein
MVHLLAATWDHTAVLTIRLLLCEAASVPM